VDARRRITGEKDALSEYSSAGPVGGADRCVEQWLASALAEKLMALVTTIPSGAV
jgi:hypothetical protein